jgi:hypothetical protein
VAEEVAEAAQPVKAPPRNRTAISIHKPAQLLTHAPEDAALGEENGVQGKGQFIGNLRSRHAVNHLAPESTPGGRSEIDFYDLHKLSSDVLVVFAVPQLTQGAIRRFKPGKFF